MKKNIFIPTVTDINSDSERSYDIYSLLLKHRVIFLSGEIHDDLANLIISQILFLSSENEKKDITLYINSYGGSVSSALAIYDTMQIVKPDISTICIGTAASAASLLLSAGKKKKRFCLENSTIMIHQVLSSVQGQASDIKIHAEHILYIANKVSNILSKHTNQTIEKIKKDSDRDYFMNSKEAKDYGIIDNIICNKI